ncbi:unnamed protein product (macronuclear) [Paramecium tetraurelia]|uniref:Uncharacterized protein n=1 Tax=Paramecium tetraurelia TaxID=5888 RepID=A0BPS7_PARTE|nr:uncharacterized protein GSPATT00005294001 [Paramecium tetraurelia]CAK60544.1 unnamed protein product [Paramecium tetraurelia]|eukprot:XP_001427942.1 hypothetical protein (macronuclear) [Paramecium tetraurelia strain d4-2]
MNPPQKKKKIKCKDHQDEDIIQICKSQICEVDWKISCMRCLKDVDHLSCDSISIKDVPQHVESHNKLFEETQRNLNKVEKKFIENIKFINEVLEGYKVDESFKVISSLEDLNYLGKVITKFPTVYYKIKEISESIQKVLEKCSIQKIDTLKQFKQDNLQATMIQRNTQILSQTQQNQMQINLEETTINQQDLINDQLEVLLKKGEENMTSQNYQIAINCFEQVLSQRPENIEAKSSLINALKEMNYFHSCFILQEKLKERDPLNFDAVFYKGLKFYLNQQYSQSIAYISPKLNNFSDPNQEKQLLKLLCNNYMENNQFVDARKILKQLASKQDNAFDVFQEFGKENVIYFKAKCYLLEGYLEEAEKSLKKATELNNNDFQNIIIQIQIFKKKKEYKQSLDLINQQLNQQIRNKDKKNLMKLKTFILLEQREYQEAMVHCQQFLENYDDDIDIYSIYGKCLLENKQYLLAIHFFEKILSQKQNHLKPRMEKVVLYNKLDSAQQILNSQNINQQNQLDKNQMNQISSRTLRNRQLQQCSQVPPFQGMDYKKWLHEAVNILIECSYALTDTFLDDCIRSFPLDETLLICKARYYLKSINTMPEYKIKATQQLQGALNINRHNKEAQSLLNSLRPQTSFGRGQTYK